MFNANRLEKKIDDLIAALKLKEQFDRIEQKLDVIAEEHGGKLAAEAAALAAELKTSVDGIQADVDAQSKS